jgi:uncharacterized integral membrane protein
MEVRYGMKLFTILALVIAIFAVVLASQNSASIVVSFLNFSYQASIGLIVLLTFTAGVLMGLFLSMPPMIVRMSKISNLRKKVEEQNKEIEELNRILAASNRNNLPQQL